MFVCCEYCVVSGRGVCDGLITRPEESYRLWRVVVCDQKTSENEEAKACYRAVKNTTTTVCNAKKTNNYLEHVNYKMFTALHSELFILKRSYVL
jgi:hypothetical protein